MPLNWIDTANLSFNNLLLLERVQISWLPGWVPEQALATALQANPAVAWFLRRKCPEVSAWLDEICAGEHGADPREVYAAEQQVLATINDLLVYVIDPSLYDSQPFLGWDSAELASLVDFSDKVVLDVGAGTGRLTFVAAPSARVVYAVEPVGNLRRYLKEKSRQLGYGNVYPQEGLIADIPFPDGFADVVMAGHVFGDAPREELDELERVTRPGGVVILCPGTSDNAVEEFPHQALLERGYRWSRFEEPQDGWKRKYWRVR